MSELEFEVDARHTAIVVIDLQKGIVLAQGAPHSTADVIANTVRLLEAARTAGAQPVLVHVGGATDGADRIHTLVDEPMRGSTPLAVDWSEFVPELNRQPGDIEVLKRQWGAFYGTDLDLQLRRRRLTTIVLCGIATEFGVESTARDAYERGYRLSDRLRRGRHDGTRHREPYQLHRANLSPSRTCALDCGDCGGTVDLHYWGYCRIKDKRGAVRWPRSKSKCNISRRDNVAWGSPIVICL